MFNSYEHLREQIRTHGLSAIEERIVQVAKPAIRIEPTPANDDDLPIGASKFGGNPDLPPGFQWPYWNNKPLTFLAQFELSDLSGMISPDNASLPERGWLLYFYSADEQPWGGWKDDDGQLPYKYIFIRDNSTPLERIPHPTANDNYGPIKALPPHQMHFRTKISIPAPLIKLELGDTAFPSGEDDQGELHQRYWEFVDAAYAEPRHHLLGYPYLIQGELEGEYAIDVLDLEYDRALAVSKYPDGRIADTNAIADKEAGNWQFLFQLSSDDDLNYCWGDSGTLYTGILKASLSAKRLEDCRTILQCY